MRKTKMLKMQKLKLVSLLMTLIALASNPALTIQAQTNSAGSSPNSATRADDDALRKACAEAVEELKAARIALERQGILIEQQRELISIETEISSKMRQINNLSELEKLELRKALLAKDTAIAALEDEVRLLKRKRFTIWKAVKIAVVAGAAGIIIGKVLK